MGGNCELCSGVSSVSWPVPNKPADYYARIVANVNGIIRADDYDYHGICCECAARLEDEGDTSVVWSIDTK